MLLRCKANEGSALGPTRVGERWHRGTEVLEELVVGELYRANAMILYNTTFFVVVVNRFGKPSSASLGYFEVVDPAIPAGWEFAAFDEGPGVPLEVGLTRDLASDGLPSQLCGLQGIWGYHEIVHSRSHFEGLINQDPAELAVFFAERDRLDHESSGRSRLAGG